MKINILSSHRFHLLDLARELACQGHDVRYYSYVPVRRCVEFGVDSSLCRSLLWLVWPFFALVRIAPKQWQESIVWYRNLLMDKYLAQKMRSCDVCIGIGTVYVRAFEAAKRNGAITILEWGSKHIIEQKRQFGQPCPTDRFTKRELRQYEVCDYISIAATHVKQSFLKHGIAEQRLLVNPYGVDLSQFTPTTCSREYDLIMVGGWRFEKGCDLIEQLVAKRGYRFLHVGSLVNMNFPQRTDMTHHDPVNQSQLQQYYAQAKVFVLPSRAEGLAMVQAQAIACGLPVVCSKETGGADLRKQLADKRWVIEIEDLTVEALESAVDQALLLAETQNNKERNYAGEALKNLSWYAYGKRYSDIIERIR